MLHANLLMDQFRQHLQEALQQEAPSCRTVTIAKHANVYVCGDRDEMVYFIQSGLVKLLTQARTGRECVLAIHSMGDVFGESCLIGQQERQETAIAMQTTVVRPIPCAQFIRLLSRDALGVGFMQYLAVRIADQQSVISNLVTVHSEQRLGHTLLHLARKLGQRDPNSLRIEQRITHEELAAMVGTTRPRISEFLQRFRALGLIELSAEHFLIVKEQKLVAYLACSA